MDKAELTRLVKTEKGMDILKISISLQSALQGGTQDNLSLEKDDVVHIRAMPQYAQALERKVYLQGEFVFPGEYSFAEGERLSAIIQRAGGLTREAYAFGAVFQRESIKALQKEQLKEYVNKLEQDILSASALAADTSLDKEQATILQETLSSKKLLLEKLKNAESTGRMVINLEEVLYVPASNYNFELRPGDRLLIAKKPDYVNVMGEVYNPTALFAEKGKTVGHYLNLVGGTTDNADNGQIYVVKANGSVISKSQGGFWGMTSWDNRNNRWTMGRFDSLELDPGDTVIVPRKVQKYAWLRLTKDITEVIYKIAISAGVVKMVGLI
jgi:protein involved in polysaccharide export with SLBB domain